MENVDNHSFMELVPTKLEGIKNLEDKVNMEKLAKLLEQFHSATGLANFIVDLKGNTLHAVGRQSVCTDFHKTQKISSERCLKSDKVFASLLNNKEKYTVYTCQNGMVNAATPIIIEGEHVASLLLCQFFFKAPDRDFFISQALDLGFNKEEYLEALDKCPVYSEEVIFKYLDFLSVLISIIGESASKYNKIETAFLHEKKLFAAALVSIQDGVILVDNNSSIVFLNRVAENLTGWTNEASKGKLIEEVFIIVNEYTREKRENIVRKVIESGKAFDLTNHTILISKDGTLRCIEVNSAPVVQENGDNSGVVLVFRDYSESKQKLYEMELLSFHDQLTGLYNKRFFEAELKRLDIERNLPMTIIMGDINGLKLINDSFGYDMGDEIIKSSAEVIKKGCRADDIIARLGGDKFMIILPQTDTFEAEDIMKRIKDLSKKERVDSIELSISFGHQTKYKKGENIQEILKNTKDNMYKRKLIENSNMRRKTIDLIMKKLFEKNKKEMIHSQRVGEICKAIANMMDFDVDAVNALINAGFMHDIGKIAINEEILNKSDKLSIDEWNEMSRHPEIGYRILSSVNEFSEIADYVLEHQERWDGKGYPRGIKGDKILVQARIISVADAFDSMTTSKAYREAFSEEYAIDEIRKCSGTQFDPDIARVFVEKVMEKNW